MYRNVFAGRVVATVVVVVRGQLEVIRKVALQLLEFVLQFLEASRCAPRWILAFLSTRCQSDIAAERTRQTDLLPRLHDHCETSPKITTTLMYHVSSASPSATSHLPPSRALARSAPSWSLRRSSACLFHRFLRAVYIASSSPRSLVLALFPKLNAPSLQTS